MFERALEFALQYHRGQEYKRKGIDWPYIVHCIKVAMHFVGDDFMMTVAVLHDVVEDTDASLSEVEVSFGEDVMRAVRMLTRVHGERYSDYIERIGFNRTATLVKLADLEENIDACMEADAPSQSSSLMKRYTVARRTLEGAMHENTMHEKWIVGEPGGPAGPFYSVVSEHGRVIAMQIPAKDVALLIAKLPALVELRYEWASIINHLANIALDGPDSNDRDYCEDMISMVLPFLRGACHEGDIEGEPTPTPHTGGTHHAA